MCMHGSVPTHAGGRFTVGTGGVGGPSPGLYALHPGTSALSRRMTALAGPFNGTTSEELGQWLAKLDVNASAVRCTAEQRGGRVVVTAVAVTLGAGRAIGTGAGGKAARAM